MKLVWEECGNPIQAMDQTSNQPGWLKQILHLVSSCTECKTLRRRQDGRVSIYGSWCGKNAGTHSKRWIRHSMNQAG